MTKDELEIFAWLAFFVIGFALGWSARDSEAQKERVSELNRDTENGL